MIIKSSHPLSPTTEIVLDGLSVNYASISGFEIELTENEHDMATITMQGIHPVAVTDYLGSAVRITINSGVGRTHTFFGYVVSTEPSINSKRGLINDSPVHSAKIRCIGASLSMKEVSSKVWDRPTLSNVVTDLARKHNFSVSYPKDSFKPTRLVQSNESDWSFLRRVVDIYGYAMSAHGTHLHIWDSAKSYSRLPSFHTLVTPKVSTGELPCSVMTFNADLGHYSVSGDTSKASITTLNDRGVITEFDASEGDMRANRSVFASGFTKPIRHPYRTLEEAKRAVNSSQRGRSLYKASAEVTAGAGILPGGIVYLTEYGGDFDGLWYVSGVLHRMGQSMYTTELTLHKNNNKNEEPAMRRSELFTDPIEPILVRGRWVTSMKKVDEYA